MQVDPLAIFAGVVMLIVSWILTASFFILNTKLEDENKRFREAPKN